MTETEAHEQAVREIDWRGVWRRAESLKTKERRK